MLSSTLTKCFSVLEIRRLHWVLGGFLALWLALAIAPTLLPPWNCIVTIGLQLQLNSIRLCVALDILIFATAWHSLERQRRLDSAIIALTFLCAAWMDFMFLSRLPGTPTFLPRTNPDAAMIFWIAARLLTGLGVLLALCAPGHSMVSQRAGKFALALTIAALGGLTAMVLADWRGFTEIQPRAGHLPPAVGNATLLLALTAGLLCVANARRYRDSCALSARLPCHHVQQDGNASGLLPISSVTGGPPRHADIFLASLALFLSETSLGISGHGAAMPSLIGPMFKAIAAICFYRAVLYSNFEMPYAAIMRYAGQLLDASQIARDKEQRLNRIILNATYAIVITDETQTIVMANPAATAMFGSAPDSMPGKLMYDYIPARQHKAFQCYIKNYARVRVSCSTPDCTIAKYDVAGLRTDGREFPLEASLSAMAEGGGHFTILILRDMTARRQTRDKLLRANDELSRLSAYLQTLRETERRDIARDLNDDLGQLLAAVRIDLSLIRKQAQGARRVEPARLDKMDELLGASISALRRIASDLRPRGLDEGGLYFALQSLRKDFEARNGIDCELIAKEQDLALDDARTTALYRVVQEALENVRRHAQATLVIIRVERRAGQLEMVIQDDGRGIRPDEQHKAHSAGLVDMRERVRALTGWLAITGEPGCGTRIELGMPLERSPAEYQPAERQPGERRPTDQQRTARQPI